MGEPMYYRVIKPFKVKYLGDCMGSWTEAPIYLMNEGDICKYISEILVLDVYSVCTFSHKGKEFLLASIHAEHHMVKILINCNDMWAKLNA